MHRRLFLSQAIAIMRTTGLERHSIQLISSNRVVVQRGVGRHVQEFSKDAPIRVSKVVFSSITVSRFRRRFRIMINTLLRPLNFR